MPQDMQTLLQQALSGEASPAPAPAESFLMRLLKGEVSNPFTGAAPTPPPDHSGEGVLGALGHAETIGPALKPRQMADAQMQAEGPSGDILRAAASGGFAGILKPTGGGMGARRPVAEIPPQTRLAWDEELARIAEKQDDLTRQIDRRERAIEGSTPSTGNAWERLDAIDARRSAYEGLGLRTLQDEHGRLETRRQELVRLRKQADKPRR
jgi:hypothetical protein